jgi:hypothetical protein
VPSSADSNAVPVILFVFCSTVTLFLAVLWPLSWLPHVLPSDEDWQQRYILTLAPRIIKFQWDYSNSSNSPIIAGSLSTWRMCLPCKWLIHPILAINITWIRVVKSHCCYNENMFMSGGWAGETQSVWCLATDWTTGWSRFDTWQKR